MGIFSIFKRRGQIKKNDAVDSRKTDEDRIREIMEEAEKHDYLAKAALAERKAKAAIRTGEHDNAWRYFHEQKTFYLKHASLSRFTKAQVLALDSQVHEQLANVLRIEKKHDDALCHILYWVIANADRPIKRHEQKLKAYFNRCKYKNTNLTEAVRFSKSIRSLPEFTKAESKVAEWKALG